ncbi:MAG: AAA family ATPase [Anaerolineales bacterium]|nr:AAA family ATPase [Anaerolineales bacterium]
MMMPQVKSLSPAELARRCDPAQFSFETTADLNAPAPIVGQARAETAVRFGLGIRQDGYNLFALGTKGSGKQTAVSQYLTQAAAAAPTPPDWCYVYNFDQAHKPHALQLPPGTGTQLRQDVDNLLNEVRAIIPSTFESEDYQAQRRAIQESFQQEQEEALEALQARAQEQDIALLRMQTGLAFAPIKDGEVISPEDFQEMSEEERTEIQQKVEALQEELQRIMLQVPQLNRQGREQIEALDREIATATLKPLFAELESTYADFSDVLTHLRAVQTDILDNLAAFYTPQNGQNALQQALQQAGQDGALSKAAQSEAFFNRYQVNVLVDNGGRDGAPIVHENHPTYQNLLGRVEQVARMGALITDFTLIKAGALHRANGGYLLLDARKLLLQPYAWESIKRALQAQEIRIESLGQTLGLISTVSLEPEPIPLDLKVALIGERYLYYMLYQLDPDFAELFKVAADFADEMPRDDDGKEAYARLVSTLAQQNDLRPFHRQAVARVVEHGSRLAGDAQRLSTHTQQIADLLREANYWCGEAGRGVVQAEDVQQALDAHQYRNGRIQERMQEAVLRDTILIDTDGEATGQINGLAVLQVGGYAFGKPSRISARVRLGKGEVVDIERKVDMSGPFHSKGVLILTGFLGGRYAAERPLSLSASLVFEQSYSGIDGDSASSAELYALLSALAETPIRQDLAVTGSVNQHGQVQAIGGVNEKIEGFFNLCRARGLTGSQGVLIPAANVKNLMLHQDVVDAVAAGQFHVYPVHTVDEGIALLTGMPAGAADASGSYPDGTFNHRVACRLHELAEKQRSFASGNGEDGEAPA